MESIEKTLEKKLRELFDDDEFVLGIMTYARHINDRKAILDFINRGEDVTDESVIVLAIELSRQREAIENK